MSLLPNLRNSPVSSSVCAMVFVSACLLGLWSGSILPLWAENGGASRAHLVLSSSDGNYTREADFGPGGQLVLTVNVADIAVHQGDAGKLKLVIDPRNSDGAQAASWVKEFTVTRQRAKLELHLPSHNKSGGSPHVDIYLPAESSVKLDVDVGNVEMDALEGNIELAIGVGNVEIHALDRDKYHDVETDVNMGNISDEVFGMNPSGFLGKDANFHGNGPWKIKLHARIGNVEIHNGDIDKSTPSNH